MYSEVGEPSLTKLPPELSEHLLQFLPSLSLRHLPLLNTQLGRQALRELETRQARLDKKQMMILTEKSRPTSILNTISMVSPGLVLLYDSSLRGERGESDERVSQAGSIVLHSQQPLFSTTSSSLSQCILTNQLAPREEVRSARRPTCFSLTSDHQDPSLSPLLIITMPVKINLARKVRNLNTWNTVHTEKDVTELVGRASVREVRLETEASEAQARLARELISRELEPDIQLYFNTDHLQAPNVYEVECSCL